MIQKKVNVLKGAVYNFCFPSAITLIHINFKASEQTLNIFNYKRSFSSTIISSTLKLNYQIYLLQHYS